MNKSEVILLIPKKMAKKKKEIKFYSFYFMVKNILPN